MLDTILIAALLVVELVALWRRHREPALLTRQIAVDTRRQLLGWFFQTACAAAEGMARKPDVPRKPSPTEKYQHALEMVKAQLLTDRMGPLTADEGMAFAMYARLFAEAQPSRQKLRK